MPPQQNKQQPEEDRLLRTAQALVLLKDGGFIDSEEGRKRLNQTHGFGLVLRSDLRPAPTTVLPQPEEQRIPIILDGGLADLEYSVGFNNDHPEGADQ